MKIEKYKEAMQSIDVDTLEIFGRLEDELSKKELKHTMRTYTKKQYVLTCILLILICTIAFVFFSENSKSKLDFTLMAYAAEPNGMQTISKDGIIISTSGNMKMGMITDYKYGNINFDLNFVCEGEGIESITYQITEDEININNSSEFHAFFAANHYGEGISCFDENIYSVLGEREDEFQIAKEMIGGSYTVSYENQNDKNYALEVNFEIDEDGECVYENFMITVYIKTLNGDVVKQKIKVIPIINNFSGVDDEIMWSELKLVYK